jgi:putative ABC transport system permease protein
MERDLREEVEAHRAMRQRELEAQGLPAEDASYASRRALGNVTLAREDARGVWIWPWLESVWQDAAYALRVLRRAPAFGAAIVFVMVLGIGTTTGVFSLLDALVLKSLPVQQPERLVYFTRPSFSYPVFQEVRARGSHVLAALSAWDMTDATIEWTTELEPAEVLTASGDFYDMLGIRAVAGRTFGPDDDRIGGGAQGLVAVISHGCWRRRFGGDPSAIGRTIRIDGHPFTIVGVTPPGFHGVTPGLAPEITIPLTSLEDERHLQSHSSSWVHMLGRLRDEVTVAQGDAVLQTFWPAVLEATAPVTMPADRRALYLANQTHLHTGHAGYSRVRNDFEEPLWLLLAFVGLLMTVACASAANLLLARGVARRREIAVRLSIGAGRSRLVRQMLTEVVIWTTIAAVVGVGFAAWGSAGLVAMMSTQDAQIVIDVTPNVRIFGFALALAFVTAAVSALIPAFRATRLDPASALKGNVASSNGMLRRWSLSKALVTVQVALTLVLLAGAALFVRSLLGVLSQDAGVDRNRVLVVATDAEAAEYQDARLIAFYDRLLERLRAIPGVESASLSQYPPISDGAWTQSVEVDGVELTPEARREVHFNVVSGDYFGTVGMRIVRGRDFAAQDGLSAAPVVAINESLARRFFEGRNPVGRVLTIGRDKGRRNLEIIAVVSDAKYQRLQEPNRSIAYLPRDQLAPMLGGRNLFAEVRAAGSLASVGESVRREVRALDARVPLRIGTVSDRIRESLVRERVTAMLAVGLGVAALALACAALYGLLAYAVSRQSFEIGLRLALGAERRAVMWLVLRECLMLALFGTVLGLGASLVLGRYVRSLLYQITPTDTIALAGAAVIMLIVAALAGSLPARRASRVDPVVALRQL